MLVRSTFLVVGVAFPRKNAMRLRSKRPRIIQAGRIPSRSGTFARSNANDKQRRQRRRGRRLPWNKGIYKKPLIRDYSATSRAERKIREEVTFSRNGCRRTKEKEGRDRRIIEKERQDIENEYGWVLYSRGIWVSQSRASALCRTYSIRTCAHACRLAGAQNLRESADSIGRTSRKKTKKRKSAGRSEKQKKKKEKRKTRKKENDVVRNYFLSIVSQEFWYAEGKLRSKVRRTIERKVEKREGREERVCVYVIYMVKAAASSDVLTYTGEERASCAREG